MKHRRKVLLMSALVLTIANLVALPNIAFAFASKVQGQNCTCEGQLSRPKTFEPHCIGPVRGERTIPNFGCDPLEVPEECLDVLERRVSGSSCDNLGWTSEFTPWENNGA